MVKNILNNLSRGIFYTLGRIIAYFLIGVVLWYIAIKLGVS